MKTPYHLLSKTWLLVFALLVLLPIVVIVMALGEFDAHIWEFLLDYQLPVLIKNTLFLMVAVGLGVITLGTSSAWLVSMYHFPLQRFFAWAMMLPLAVPAYVLAFVQLGMFEYSGAISTYLRQSWGFAQGLPDIRNGFGVAVIMSLTFYPYVYLLAKNAFATMGNKALEAGASLGLSPYQSFVKIALPMARPWIAGGAILALMEVLADFGTVSVFGFETFTTAIYDAWFGFFSLETAKQLASLLIGFVFLLVVLEQLSRGKRRFEVAGRSNSYVPKPLTGSKKWLASAYCGTILLLAFVIPLIQLLIWASHTWSLDALSSLSTQAWYSFVVAILSALLVAIVAFGIALASYHDKSKFAIVSSRLATLGYAVPGTVLAVGVFVPVAWLDNVLLEYLPFGEGTTEIFKGTLAVMLIAYLIRFLALGVSSLNSGIERIKPNYIEAAHTFGLTGWHNVRTIYLPLLKKSIGTAMLIVFVDVMKEMPITLMMRPFDWDMLSVRIYAFTTEGIYDKAALPALVIVLVGLIPVILFSKLGQKS
ncbi:MAG: iron ABC transporter permease [Moraxella sp.]|nr:iron ABC transporter permease [Moraxella sp.]